VADFKGMAEAPDLNEPDIYDLVGHKLLVPKKTWQCPEDIFGDAVDGFEVGEIIQCNKKKLSFNIQFRNERSLARKVFVVDWKYILDYIEELPEQFEYLRAIHQNTQEEKQAEKPTKEKEAAKRASKQSKAAPNASDDTVNDAENAENRPKKKTKASAELTEIDDAAGVSVKQKAKVGRPKTIIGDSVLSDAETDNDVPPDSDDSDLDDNSVDGEDNVDWEFGRLPSQHPIQFTSASGPQTSLNPETAKPIDYFFLFVSVTWFSLWAQYTKFNSYATMRLNLTKQANKTPRRWKCVSTAEIKAWIGTIIYQCLLLNLSSTMF
jgi:hypothetical protein